MQAITALPTPILAPSSLVPRHQQTEYRLPLLNQIYTNAIQLFATINLPCCIILGKDGEKESLSGVNDEIKMNGSVIFFFMFQRLLAIVSHRLCSDLQPC